MTLKNREGVLLRYAEPRAHHGESLHRADDRERMALILAERELLTLQVIAEHGEFSDVAMTRIYDALDIVRRALNMRRPMLGMQRRPL